MDWKVGIVIGGGQIVDLSTVVDPVGAAFMALELFPVASRSARIPEAQVRAALRQGFTRFGRPAEIQTDGEPGLNSAAHDGFPAPFQLWLAGLGIRHRRTRPGVATDDATVERGHRTVYDYVLAGQEHQDLATLQQALARAQDELNAAFPSRGRGCGGRPPFQAHPELLQPQRPYTLAQEAELFDMNRVDAYLAERSWERKVGKTGQITLGGAHRTYSVGRPYAGQTVRVRFDPQDRSFVAEQPQPGDRQKRVEIKRWPARLPSAEEIMDLPKTV